MKNRKKWVIHAGMAAAFVVCLTGCAGKNPLDAKNPVSLTIWHYYNGSQQVAFDTLVEEFNSTVGREKGIFVESYSQGSVSDLETAVRASISGKVGAAVKGLVLSVVGVYRFHGVLRCLQLFQFGF